MYDIGILNGEVYIDGQFLKINLYIQGDKISAITPDIHPCKRVLDVEGRWILPGFIDPHVHFALDVGKYQSADDFYSGSISGAYGGITTYIDFLDPVSKASDIEAALNKRLEQAKNSVTDYSFHVTVANPKGEVDGIVKEMDRLQLQSVKLFTTYSDSDRRTYDDEIEELLSYSKEQDFVVLAHIENDDMISLKESYLIKDLPISRPALSETSEALKLASLVTKSKGKLYMVHCSLGQTVDALVSHHEAILGKNMFIESCPHYFTLTDEVFKGESGYKYILAPPLRDEKSIKTLMKFSAYINSIGTDHCPFMEAEKNREQLMGTPMGIGGIEYSFDLMYTHLGLAAIDKMTKGPAEIFGLYPQKGSLQIGTDADIVIYNPHERHIIGDHHSQCDFNVYKGLEVKGQVETTILRGEILVKKGKLQTGIKGMYLNLRREYESYN